MTQYLISFGAHAMDHIPDEDAPAVARAAHAAVQEAINADVYVSAGGLGNQPASIVATDGAVTDGPYPEAIGGFMLAARASRLGDQVAAHRRIYALAVVRVPHARWRATVCGWRTMTREAGKGLVSGRQDSAEMVRPRGSRTTRSRDRGLR